MKTFKTTSTSKNTADVEDIILCETTTTRRVLRAQLVKNEKSAKKSVKATLVHQRKGTNDGWEDFPSKPFSQLKAGEEAKFVLGTDDTRELAENLYWLYCCFKELGGVPWGEKEHVIAPSNQVVVTKETLVPLVQGLVNSGLAESAWKELSETNPTLTERLSYARLHQSRVVALREFASALRQGSGEREFWDGFFARNTWIFGYGLDFRFLETLQNQPHYGGVAVAGRGGQRGDYLTATDGDARFTVLVEIKAPTTKLLKAAPTRNGGYPVSTELASGVAQVQVNCRTWDNEGSRTEANSDMLRCRSVSTVEPRGILVIGNLSQLSDTNHKNSFELFRRNIANPEIITFDELYRRAKFIVRNTAQDEQ